jgi:alkaline phosphatase D
VITGDKHMNSVRRVPPSYLSYEGTVASEFVGTSISSGGQRTLVPFTPESWNPQILWEDLHHGYVRVDATPERWRSDFRVIDTVERPDNVSVWTESSWQIPPDDPVPESVPAV